MKKMMLLVVGLFSVTQVMADPIYRPYATCTAPNNKTDIRIMQNTDAKDKSMPFSFSVERMIQGNKVSMHDQGAVKIPVENKNVLEMFQSFELSEYAFNLVVSNATSLLSGEYKGVFTDIHGSTVVYCSHDITFGN
jgi:hypothetical protein